MDGGGEPDKDLYSLAIWRLRDDVFFYEKENPEES